MAHTIRPAGLADIPSIQRIAASVWPVAYRDILSPEQLQYMLALFYSESALTGQMEDGGHRFFLASTEDEMPAGFASFSISEKTAQLHKLYVPPQTQGSGTGAALLQRCEEEAARCGAGKIQLNVNRHNRARTFYERHGYRIISEEDIDIGHGFFMNDFRMEKNLTDGAGV